jgi:hypothetical protein
MFYIRSLSQAQGMKDKSFLYKEHVSEMGDFGLAGLAFDLG